MLPLARIPSGFVDQMLSINTSQLGQRHNGVQEEPSLAQSPEIQLCRALHDQYGEHQSKNH